MDNLSQASSSPLSPETFMRNWQETGTRILRAQERMLHGVATAAKLEMRFGQEFMEGRLSLLKWTETDNQTRADHARQEVDKLVTLMRDVTEELRVSFTEAARLLADASEDAVEHASEQAHAGAEQASEVLHKTAQASQEAVQTGAEIARQTTARTQRNISKTSELVQQTAEKNER